MLSLRWVSCKQHNLLLYSGWFLAQILFNNSSIPVHYFESLVWPDALFSCSLAFGVWGWTLSGQRASATPAWWSVTGQELQFCRYRNILIACLPHMIYVHFLACCPCQQHFTRINHGIICSILIHTHVHFYSCLDLLWQRLIIATSPISLNSLVMWRSGVGLLLSEVVNAHALETCGQGWELIMNSNCWYGNNLKNTKWLPENHLQQTTWKE